MDVLKLGWERINTVLCQYKNLDVSAIVGYCTSHRLSWLDHRVPGGSLNNCHKMELVSLRQRLVGD